MFVLRKTDEHDQLLWIWIEELLQRIGRQSLVYFSWLRLWCSQLYNGRICHQSYQFLHPISVRLSQTLRAHQILISIVLSLWWLTGCCHILFHDLRLRFCRQLKAAEHSITLCFLVWCSRQAQRGETMLVVDIWCIIPRLFGTCLVRFIDCWAGSSYMSI